MSSSSKKAMLAAMALAFSAACEEEKKEAAPSAKPAPPPAPEPAPAPAPAPVVKKPTHPCPEGSKGEGTFDKPCVATGGTRAMEVTWNGKIGDKGPTFKVINKTNLEIVYGNVVVYYYDKAGKQLTVGESKRKRASCSGNIFAGPMKAEEKAFFNFSCTKKESVPEGAHAIEAEMQMVGFTGAEGDRPDTYWKNEDLTPEDRKKGGVK